MSGLDMFEGIARHYDAIMSHVFYDRWLMATTELATLLPGPVRHCDAACGTGVLMQKLARTGLDTRGFDLSLSMLRTAARNTPGTGLVQADLRALPFDNAFPFMTCLFDSVNFLLDASEARRAFRELAEALSPGGILYFDIVTERMVLDHFDGQGWTEKNGGITTQWHSIYNRSNHICETEVRVNTGPATLLQERVYDLDEVLDWVRSAGLSPIVILDAENWRSVRRKTLRVDIVAGKQPATQLQKGIEDLFKDLHWH